MRPGAPALVGILLWAAPAAAEGSDSKFDRTLDLVIGGGCGMFTANQLKLRHNPSYAAPEVLDAAEPTLSAQGTGCFGSAGTRLTYHGFRGGYDVGIMGPTGTWVEHGPLPRGYELTAKPILAVPVTVSLGYAFGSARSVRPYLEAYATLTPLFTKLELFDARKQSLGATPYAALAGAVGLGAGAIVPLNDYFFIDAGVRGDVVGPMLPTFHAAIGLPIPLANL
jgi:hypothetical protein